MDATIVIPSELVAALRTAERIAVLTGTGVPAESGVPTGCRTLDYHYLLQPLFMAFAESQAMKTRPNALHRTVARPGSRAVLDTLLATVAADRGVSGGGR